MRSTNGAEGRSNQAKLNELVQLFGSNRAACRHYNSHARETGKPAIGEPQFSRLKTGRRTMPGHVEEWVDETHSLMKRDWGSVSIDETYPAPPWLEGLFTLARKESQEEMAQALAVIDKVAIGLKITGSEPGEETAHPRLIALRATVLRDMERREEALAAWQYAVELAEEEAPALLTTYRVHAITAEREVCESRHGAEPEKYREAIREHFVRATERILEGRLNDREKLQVYYSLLRMAAIIADPMIFERYFLAATAHGLDGKTQEELEQAFARRAYGDDFRHLEYFQPILERSLTLKNFKVKGLSH